MRLRAKRLIASFVLALFFMAGPASWAESTEEETLPLLPVPVPAPAQPSPAAAEETPMRSFEVRATSTVSYFIDGEKVKKNEGGDQIIFFIDLPHKIVKRVAVYYARKKKREKILPGLYAKPQEYSLISYKHDFMKNQLIIKAMAQTEGENDGFETLVIGEDFVASSISAKGYFTVTYYDRVDEDAIAFKRKQGKLEEEESKESREVSRVESSSSDLPPAETAAVWFGSKMNQFKKWRKGE